MDTRRLDDAGMLIIGWCGVLALLGHGQTSGSPRRRVASIATGLALLMLAHLIDGDHRLATSPNAFARAARRLLNQVARLFRPQTLLKEPS